MKVNYLLAIGYSLIGVYIPLQNGLAMKQTLQVLV